MKRKKWSPNHYIYSVNMYLKIDVDYIYAFVISI